jgi:predicted porin
MVGYERNQVDTKFWTVAGSYKVGMANLMASYAQQKDVADNKIKGITVGADIEVGSGNVKVGFGQNKVDATDAKDRKFGIGYWHNLSKRTYLYTDYARTKVTNADGVNAIDLGIHHSF